MASRSTAIGATPHAEFPHSHATSPAWLRKRSPVFRWHEDSRGDRFSHLCDGGTVDEFIDESKARFVGIRPCGP